MTYSNGDRLAQYMQYVTEFYIRTEHILMQHDERIWLLEDTQAGIQRILDRLTGGNND